MPLKKQSIRGRTKRAVRSNPKRSAPSSSETTTDVAGNTNSTPDHAASASSNPEPATAPPPVRSIELNESVLERNEPQNCSIDRDKDLIANRNRNQDNDETLIRNSELVVERDEGNMDVNVSGGGGGGDVDGEREEGVKKKKTKVVKVVKKVVRVVKKRVPVRKGGPLIASAVENSGGAVLLPMQEQEIDKSDDNVVEEGGKFESLVSSSVGLEDYGAGQPLVAGKVGGSGRLGSVSMEEQEMDECGDKVVVGSKEFESMALSPIMVGVVEDAEHSDKLASVCMEVENLETLRVSEAGEKEGVVEKCEPVVDMVLEDEASGEHENISREGVTVGDDSDMGSRGLALSGELEAMERRKRRKTEIFIGGLHLSATEEDLKKAFVDVGEVVKVRLVLNFKTGKNRGFAFVRFASAADAKKALEKYPKVEICGKQCSTQHVEGNDTIFVGNIDKKWKEEDVIKLLQEIGIENIDKVTVIPDPGNIERNRGFAFLELATIRDAQVAFGKLQRKDILGKLKNIKVSWAEPLSETNEEELMKVRSVYAEFLPPSWDEEKVRNYFEKFGDIENVAHSRNLRSSRRKDFAFINFTTREAALACVESFNHGNLSDEASEINIKVSLAKPMAKSKSNLKVSKLAGKEIPKQKNKAIQSPVTPKHRNKAVSAPVIGNNRTAISRPNNSSELEKILAERALLRQSQARLGTGLTTLEYASALPGMKRPFSALGHDQYHSDHRANTHLRMDHSFPVASTSQFKVFPGVGMTSLSYLSAQEAEHAAGHGYGDNADSFQSRAGPHKRSSNLHYRY